MEGLFSALDLEHPTADHRAGFRLERLEVLNWGTFDSRVWTFDIAGNNALLTGDIGSGKSTLVDAVTTLLLPSQRISYNKAAGAETRERTLRSYVLGHHKSERSETTGTSRPVGLRDSRSYSAIVGVFVNRGYDETVSLAQVFWTREGDGGQPQRFFVTAGRDLSIARDLSGFGADVTALKKRLREQGDQVRDHFPEYGKDLRRRLGIASEQALELFHQTVSLKSVGDLNDFVRSHMLEPFHSASWTDRLVAHFEDLTRAHEAVLKAKEQLSHLDPLLQDCDRHDELARQITALAGQRAAVRFFCAEMKAASLADRITSLDATLARQHAALDDAKDHLRDLTERRERLQLERAGLGGDRLAELERALAEDERTRDARRARFCRYHELLTEAGLDRVDGAEEFERRQAEVARETVGADDAQSDVQNRLTEVAVRVEELKREAQEVNAELVSLGARRSNIPKRSLDIRDRLCDELRLPEAELPFAGELIAVRDDASEWEGAAERLLRGFGLALLVRAEHYREVSDWINDHHLGARLVYYRVPANLGPDTGRGGLSAHALATKLQIKDSPFFPWLERELANRAAHECVETMDEFRRAAKALTREGQVKGPGGRHEKDDVTGIGDRRSYVLGWTNEQKVDALLEQAGAVSKASSAAGAEQERLRRALSEAAVRQNVLGKLDEYRSFAELDWHAMVNRIAAHEAEKRRIEQSSGELTRIARELDDVAGEMSQAETQRDALTGDVARAEAERGAAGREMTRVRAILDDPHLPAARDHFEELRRRFGTELPTEPGELDRFESYAREQLTELIEDISRRQSTVASRVVGRMRDFRIRYPLDTAEFDDSVQSMGEYRALHDRLVGDDLPRFEAEFKRYLNTNTIRDIATFQSQLNKQRELIRSRIETINESLAGIAYNPGRYITLEAHPTPNTEIRDFRSDLRACTESSLGADDTEQYSEEKFLQVKRIVERFKGREGQTDADRAWTQRVTDVRNWFVFSACERWEADGSEYETYTDSGGKSGGQKEKLAYTILAASLAYQFKLEWGAARSRDFRFVVIDEAFGRGSDESTRFALQLFRRLGLQLLIVTPLQKIHVIEPFVSAVGYVENRSGAWSQLQTLTVEEYRERRQQVAAARARVAMDPDADVDVDADLGRGIGTELGTGVATDVDAEALTVDALGGR